MSTTPPKPYASGDGWTLYHGDCRVVLPTLAGIDAIVTDPPYPHEFDCVWDYLADYGHQPCVENAFLCTLMGHYQMPRVMDAMRRNWKFFWCGMLPNKAQPIMHGFSVKVCWKPFMVFRRGRAKPRRIWYDNFDLRARCSEWSMSQMLHKWGQPASAMIEPITAFSSVGETVLDPFCGSGTTGAACRQLERRFVGIEIDERSCEIAAYRIAGALSPNTYRDDRVGVAPLFTGEVA